MNTGYWPDDYVAKQMDAASAIRLVQSGQRVFIGSSCGEPQHLVKELAAQKKRLADIEILRLMSLESTPLSLMSQESQGDEFNVRSFYLGSGMPKRLAAGQRFFTPINLSALPMLFSTRRIPLHVALIQTSPPDDFGWMSLGVSVDITMAAAQAADLVIAQVNPRMPRVLGRSFLHVNDVDVIVEQEEDIISVGATPNFDQALDIGRHVASLLDDGSTIQISLGSTTQAIFLACGEKNDLGVHTQFMMDGIMHLVARGVVTNRKKTINQGKLVAATAIGSKDLYEFLHDNPSMEFHPSDYVNNPSVLAQHRKMVAVELAEAIDLTGQVAADALPFNHYSGVSGVCDFIRGAAMAPEGKAILMLSSSNRDATKSRIMTRLQDPVVVPRGDVHYVVTEYGAVNLFGKNLSERALAMISIAHPNFRDQLFEEAKDAGLIPKKRTASEILHSIYPAAMEKELLIGGQPVLFRPVKSTDSRLLQEHLYSLDRKDIIARFLHNKATFARDEVEGLFGGDYYKDYTIVAVIGDLGFEKIIAVSGYLTDPAKNIAEVSFSVDKAWQGKGMGKELMKLVSERARESGISGLFAYVSPTNRSMIRLFFSLPYKVHTSFDRDILYLSCKFSEPKTPEETPAQNR